MLHPQHFVTMERGRRLERSIYSRFNATWDFAMRRAKISVRQPTGC
jgi:hypothetical protein